MIESERKRAEAAETEALQLSVHTKQLQSKEASAAREAAMLRESLLRIQNIADEGAKKSEEKCLAIQVKLNVSIEEREAMRVELIEAQQQIQRYSYLTLPCTVAAC